MPPPVPVPLLGLQAASAAAVTPNLHTRLLLRRRLWCAGLPLLQRQACVLPSLLLAGAVSQLHLCL